MEEANQDPASVSQILTQVENRPRFEIIDLSPEAKAEAARRAEDERQRHIYHRWEVLRKRIGERYARCKLETFDVTNDAQRAVVEAVKSYCESIADRIGEGGNVVLIGPKGTGKDHLLTCLMKAALKAGKTVQFWSGVDLWSSLRDAISTDTPEREWIKQSLEPDVFAISDPLPPIGSLTDFQTSNFFRLVDARYRAMKPVWITTNSGGKDADTRAGSQTMDRIRDGATIFETKWDSYRKAAK